MSDFTCINQHIGRQLRLRREGLRLSVADLAQASGLFSAAQLERYESGSYNVPAAMLWVLTGYLDCSFEYFFDGLARADSST